MTDLTIEPIARCERCENLVFHTTWDPRSSQMCCSACLEDGDNDPDQMLNDGDPGEP